MITARRGSREGMIIIGLVLLLAAFLLGIPVLWTIGIIAIVVGVILLALGYAGRPVGGRRHYWLPAGNMRVRAHAQARSRT